jgi:hypothetical protein
MMTTLRIAIPLATRKIARIPAHSTTHALRMFATTIEIEKTPQKRPLKKLPYPLDPTSFICFPFATQISELPIPRTNPPTTELEYTKMMKVGPEP